MCGIAGVWSVADFALSREALPRMTTAIAHRGPDDAGHWFDEAAGIALGHRRLSIVDLSPAGHQPMASASTPEVAPRVRSGTAARDDSSAYCVAVKLRLVSMAR